MSEISLENDSLHDLSAVSALWNRRQCFHFHFFRNFSGAGAKVRDGFVPGAAEIAANQR
jgi:hypothetical protein